ncbi:MAG: hypothetical protein ACI31P_03930, partial [Ligilactobacillus ruminis]
VYPKNNIKTETKVDKDVKVIGNKHQGVKVGEEFDWIIRGSVPTDLYQKDSKGNGNVAVRDIAAADRAKF